MSAAITITIGGVDKTSLIDWQSVSKNEVVTKESDIFTFIIKNYGTKTYQPTLGDEVIFTYGATRKFAGYVVQMNEEMAGLSKSLKVTVKDYSQILNRQLVSKTYTSMTGTAIIQDLISTFTSGITTTNVVAPVTIPKVVFNYITVSECLKQLAKILSNYEWYIDYTKDIHFFSTSTVLAPFSISDTTQNYAWQTLKVQNDTSKLRNEVIVRGGLITSTTLRTEYFSGDATKTSFALSNSYPTVPTVTVGGVAKTVGIDFLDLDASYQVMWNYNTQSLRFTAGNTPAAATNNIVVTGYPQYPLILRKQNQTSVTLYGVFQSIIIDKTIQNIDTASARADVELNKYSLPEATGTFTTYTDGLIAGQLITVGSTIRGISRVFKIQSIKTTIKIPASIGSTSATLRYEVQIVSADYTSINDILNKLLVQDPAAQLDISANEVVQRYYQFPETVTLSDTLNAPTKSSSPYKWDGVSGTIDSYSEANQDASVAMPSFGGVQYTDVGQTFTPTSNAVLTSCQFYLKKQGTPTGTLNMTAKLYATSGGLPTGSALASSTPLTANSLTTSYVLTTFTFGTTYLMMSGVTYAIILEYTTGGASTNNIVVGVDNSSGTHAGGAVGSIDSGASWFTKTYDVCFYVTGNASALVWNFGTWS